MAYCSKCGKEVMDEAEICIHCGCRIKNPQFFNGYGSYANYPMPNPNYPMPNPNEPLPNNNVNYANLKDDGKNIFRFLLVFFLGFIGSFIINHTGLKPQGWKSRTCAYFFWNFLFGAGFIYWLVGSLSNLGFSVKKGSNIGYFKD